MAGIFLWTLRYYLFRSYFYNYPRAFYIFSFCLSITIRFRCLGLAQGLRVRFRGTSSSSTDTLTSDHAIFFCEHEVMLKLCQNSIQSRMMRTFKYVLCVSSSKWTFHAPWKCQACKREPP